jgi:hypothetical protein
VDLGPRVALVAVAGRLVETIGAWVSVVEGTPLCVPPQADKASDRLRAAAIDAA